MAFGHELVYPPFIPLRGLRHKVSRRPGVNGEDRRFCVGAVITAKRGESREGVYMWTCHCFPFISALMSFLPVNPLCIEYLKDRWVAGDRISCRESLVSEEEKEAEGVTVVRPQPWAVGGQSPHPHSILLGLPDLGNPRTALHVWDMSVKYSPFSPPTRGLLQDTHSFLLGHHAPGGRVWSPAHFGSVPPARICSLTGWSLSASNNQLVEFLSARCV